MSCIFLFVIRRWVDAHDHTRPVARPHATGGKASLFTWAITCLLLSLVSAIFAFGGTAGDTGGRYARMVMVGLMVAALVMLFIRRYRRDR